MGKVLSTCGFCGCGCGIFLEVKNGRVVGVAPEKAHPTSRGTLCFKGWNGFRALRHPDRLKQPLLRQNGELKPVKWSAALDHVTGAFKSIVEKYGPGAVGVVGSTKTTNEEAFLLCRFARACLGTNNIDTAVRLTHGPTLAVLPRVLGHLGRCAHILDIPESDFIFLIGENPKEQVARVGAYVLRAAKDGVPLAVVDPRRTDLATFATVHLAVRPGTDATLLLGLVREMVTRDLVRSKPPEFSALRALAEPYTLERVSSECGVAAEDVRRVADLLGQAEKPLILYGAGATGQVNGSAIVALLWDLTLLAGAGVGEWSGIMPLHHSNNERGACDFGLLPDFLPGYQPVGESAALKKFEGEWGGPLPSAPGKTLGEMLQAALAGELKALYVVGENLLRLWPNTSAVKEALGKLELLVVQDLFLTETAAVAHAVLPAAAYAEKEGTVTNLEGRVQVLRKAVEPPGEARPDFEIFTDLLSRFGHKVREKNPSLLFQTMAGLVPGYEGLSWDSVAAAAGGVLVSPPGSPGEPKLLVPEIREALEKPDAEFPMLGFVGSPPFHWRTGTMVEHSHALAREYPEPEVWLHTEDAQELGLRAGMPVKVMSRRGAVQRTVRVSRDVPKGTFFVPIHFRNGHTVEILADGLEPESKTPALRSFAGKLEKLG